VPHAGEIWALAHRPTTSPAHSGKPVTRLYRRFARLLPTRKALGFPPRGAALHVDDLALKEGQHLIALVSSPVGACPVCRADDRLVADLRELGLHFEPLPAPLLDLELEDLTGLARAVSGRGALPPEEPARDAAPLGIFSEEGGEGFRVASIERLGCRPKPVDHRPSMAGRGTLETLAPQSVELLYFQDCPNHKAARELAEPVA
jgi:hypothetical protein